MGSSQLKSQNLIEQFDGETRKGNTFIITHSLVGGEYMEESQLSTLLSRIAAEYPAPGEIESSQSARSIANYPELQDVFRQTAQSFEEMITSAFGTGWEVDYGFGQGTLNNIPYIAIFRDDMTDTTQRGVYPLCLFDPIDDAIYLTLNQGGTEMNRLRQSDDVNEPTAELLHQQAEYYRGMPGSGEYDDIQGPWKAQPATLSSSLRQADKYNNGTILHASYSSKSLNSEDILSDLLDLIQIYDSFLDITYKQLRLELENRRGFAVSIPSVGEWSHWVEEGYAITGIGDQSESVVAINPDDVILAGRTDNITDYVVGIGVVQESLSNEANSELCSTAEDHGIDPADGQLYPVAWKSFYSGGVPVTVPRKTDRLFSQSTAQTLSTELINRIISAVGHRYGAIENHSTRSLADSLLEGHSLADALSHVELESPRPNQNDGSDELHSYWRMVETKRELAQRFIESPQETTFAELVNQDHFWATRAFGSLDYYIDKLVFADQTPAEVAAVLEAAIDDGLEQDGSLQAVLELDGFGWPVATELLRALIPNEFAILNTHAEKGMSALGKSPPSPQTASVEDYIAFVDEVEAAAMQYEFDKKIADFTDESIPGWASNTEIADRAFTLHLSEGLGLRAYTEVDEDEVVADTWSPPTDTFGTVSDVASISSLYFPSSGMDGASIATQIDRALRSGKHIILTGAPGSGKTELAKQICEHYIDHQYALVTATDDWSTFDTIGGYQPDQEEQLTFRPGVFLQRFLRQTNPPRPTNEWLIIDELNRADIDKAFGSLFSALTGNNVMLPFENAGGQIELVGAPEHYGYKPITAHHYYIPPDWRMIATMNTADKSSLYRMSYAFMRRFAYISVPTPTIGDIDADLLREYTAEARWDIDFSGFEGADEAAIHQDVAAVWETVQRRRTIGPAIIKDVLEHIEQQLLSGTAPTYSRPVAIYIFPQLEGLPQPDVSSMLDEMDSRVNAFDREVTDQIAADYLDMDFNT